MIPGIGSRVNVLLYCFVEKIFWEEVEILHSVEFLEEKLFGLIFYFLHRSQKFLNLTSYCVHKFVANACDLAGSDRMFQLH
jgi:hypothetical protein